MTAEQIADLAKKKARDKIPQITASVADHRLSDHQRFLIRHALRHLEFLDQEVEALNQEIRRRMEDPALAEAFQLLQSIPGIKEEIRRQHPGRDRRRHGTVPDGGATQLLGRTVSGEPRECRGQEKRSYEPRKRLNSREIELLQTATPKRDYYIAQRLGRRMISFRLGPVALAFLGVSGQRDRARIEVLAQEYGDGWISVWMKERNVRKEWIDFYEGAHKHAIQMVS